MSEGKIETAKGMCVIALTRHIMERQNLGYEDAYRKLLTMELYKLLQDSETRLFLETNEYLNGAYDNESEGGKDALYKYIEQ